MIKCEIKIKKIMYPKNKAVESGEYAIFAGEVIKHISGEKPIINVGFRTVSLKGNVPAIEEGNTFTIIFDKPETNNYGTSYSVVSISKEIDPTNKNQLKEYLNLVCGKTIAEELIKLENPYQLLTNKNDEELLKVKGIGESRLEQIYKNIGTYADYSQAYIALEPLGLTKNQIKNICLATGGAISAVEICKTNAYSLIDKVKGIGFKVADDIALKCGLSPFDDKRIKAAIKHILSICGESGKSYLLAHQLLQEIRKIISLEFFKLDSVIRQMVESNELCLSNDGMKVALPYYIKLEQDIANEIRRLVNAKSVIKIPENWKEQVKEIEEIQGWEYTDEQFVGIERVLLDNLVVICGKAGSGKSSITNAMTAILNMYDISLCCLSAKAAQRLRELTNSESASTIHKLLGLGLENKEDIDTQILSDIIIIDEASMISGSLFLTLLKSIKTGAKVIILGDDGQLTSIGNCAVFADLLRAKILSVVELTKIHRQAEKSAIITQSINIRKQIPICKKDFKGHMVLGELQDLELFMLDQEDLLYSIKKKFLEDLEIVKDILEVQVISALKTRGALSIKNINNEIQALVNPKTSKFFTGANDTKIYINDKVINLKNNYKAQDVEGMKKAVFNGSIGIVTNIDSDSVTIDFVGIGKVVIEKENFNNINLAYAISCHSAQGSQWQHVICAFDMSSYILLNVELLYTAITRAMLHCSLIIDQKTMEHCLRTVEQKTKQTLLPMFLSSPN